MKMHILPGGRLRMKKSIFFPGADRADTVDLPVSAYLLRHSQGNVLFDTGCHPSVVEHAGDRWGGLAKAMVPVFGPEDQVLGGLSNLGLGPDDVDAVIASHLHPDHCGCNEFFKRATIMCHAKEAAAVRAPGAEKLGYLRVDWDQGRAFDEMGGPRDVFGDGRIVVVPLPGHTPGSVGALIELDASGGFLLASDALAMRAYLDGEIVPRNTWNTDEFARSLSEMRKLEQTGVTIICGHDLEQWQTLKKGADAYD
jgi:N-acyl homoserine lactone hydrolase